MLEPVLLEQNLTVFSILKFIPDVLLEFKSVQKLSELAFLDSVLGLGGGGGGGGGG